MAVKSITFTGTGENDYLNKIAYVNKLRRGKTEEEYNKALNIYDNSRRESPYRCRSDIFDAFYRQVKDGYANDLARSILIGRTFNFSTDKINIIFGPNACGKSTILKTIAAHALCGSSQNFDGYTNGEVYEPLDYHRLLDDGEKYTINNLKEKIDQKAGNAATVDWDGNPVYYHNYSNRRNTGSVDDFVGSILGSLGDAMLYESQKKSMSDGKKSMYILAHLYEIANQHLSTPDIITSTRNHGSRVNYTWKDCFENTVKYLESVYDPTSPHQNTLLLDEIDKSLDIFRIKHIFKEILPEIASINNTQIIVISHSPIVLASNVCSPDMYNFISMHDGYTEKVKELLSNLTF